MHQLLIMLLLWQVASATIDRARSHSEIKTIINELPSRVEESTVQNTKGQHKRHRVHKNLFDGAVVPSPRIINGFSVSSRLSFYELCVFETSPTLPNLIHISQAPEDRYPHAVSLQYTNQHYCGASLVAPDMILTAAVSSFRIAETNIKLRA
jgi:hypothetical protein